MFARSQHADRNGISLQVYLDNLNFALVQKLFGEPDPNAYQDEEKGYDGNEYLFVEQSTGLPVNLYARWGDWRVGAHEKATAERFATWLRSLI